MTKQYTKNIILLLALSIIICFFSCTRDDDDDDSDADDDNDTSDDDDDYDYNDDDDDGYHDPFDFYGVWGSGPSDVFAVGYQDTILHYDGSSWIVMDSGQD